MISIDILVCGVCGHTRTSLSWNCPECGKQAVISIWYHGEDQGILLVIKEVPL